MSETKQFSGVPISALVAGGLILAIPCYFAMFSGFANWDDEGYVLMTLREYARGGALYDQVYSEYGPAFYELVSGLFTILGVAITHNAGRLFTLTAWLATATLCALAIQRLTRNLVVALCTEILVAGGLWMMKLEPPHPGGSLALVLGALTFLASFLDATPTVTPAAAIGALLATAMLMKINVGGFAVAAGVCALLATARGGRAGRALASGSALAACLIPPLLMYRLWDAAWAQRYCAVVWCSVVAVLLTQLRRAGKSDTGLRDLLAASISFALAVATICGVAIARGTTLSGLVHGIVLNPLNHPSELSIPLDLPSWAPWWALLSSVVAVAWIVLRSDSESRDSTSVLVIGGLQLLAGGAIWLAAAIMPLQIRMALSLPLLWIAVVPGWEGKQSCRGQAFIMSLAALQTLHAYPVAGTQLAWSTFLFVPVGAIGIADGWRHVAPALGARFAILNRRVPMQLAGAVLIAACFMTAIYPSARWSRWVYKTGVPLGLPGTAGMHLPESEASVYRWLANELTSRCATFLTVPGLNSFYFFTRIEPPTLLNTTHWMTMFSHEQQAVVRDRFMQVPGPHCIVRNQSVANKWTNGGTVSDDVLLRFIDERFITVASRGDYEFMMERGPIGPSAARR